MKTIIVGAGPAGLFTALLLKARRPAASVTVFEQRSGLSQGGWGIVVDERQLETIGAMDPPTGAAITQALVRVDNQDVHYGGIRLQMGGSGFCMSRRVLLDILARRAEGLGVVIRFDTAVDANDQIVSPRDTPADVVVVAEGARAAIRDRHAAEFGTTVDLRTARFLWLGTAKLFHPFAYVFRKTETGVYQAHAHQFDATHSTFVVETDEASWHAAGFATMTEAESVAACERLFADWLDGQPLLTQRSSGPTGQGRDPWRRFAHVRNARWHAGKLVLVGDTARTVHFSLGKGANLALGDAMALAEELTREGDCPDAFARYESRRRGETATIESHAERSMRWFETVSRRVHLAPQQFARSLARRCVDELELVS